MVAAKGHLHRWPHRRRALVSHHPICDLSHGEDSRLAFGKDRGELVDAIHAAPDRLGYRGVVLDFEQLPPSARAGYPELVHELGVAAGSRQVVVAVPAPTSGPLVTVVLGSDFTQKAFPTLR